jgi:hypothetical protein
MSAVLGGRARQHFGIGRSCETDPDDVGRVVAGRGQVVSQPMLDRLVEQEPHALWSSAIVRWSMWAAANRSASRTSSAELWVLLEEFVARRPVGDHPRSSRRCSDAGRR